MTESNSPDNERRDGHSITRRQFLDGVAIGAAGLAFAAADPTLTGAQAASLARTGDPVPLPADYYPPTSTGITGQPDPVIDRIMKIDGPPRPGKVHDASGGPGIHARTKDLRETYDAVIVGAGISGLSAAKYYRDRFGPDARILLIDPLPDFGGHAHRNEFHVTDATTGDDVLMLRNGGAVNLDSPRTWSQVSGAQLDVPPAQAALDVLDYLGGRPRCLPQHHRAGAPQQLRPVGAPAVPQ